MKTMLRLVKRDSWVDARIQEILASDYPVNMPITPEIVRQALSDKQADIDKVRVYRELFARLKT